MKTQLLSLFFICTVVIQNNLVYSQSLQWRILPNSPSYNSYRLDDIFFLNANTGWTVNFGGTVFRTIDAGHRWDTVFRVIGGAFRSIGFFDSQNGILGTLHDDSNKVLYKTTNGGLNFGLVTNIPNPRILGVCGINIVSENIAYACGRWNSPARIIKTTDKGMTWTSCIIDTLLAKSLVDCYFWSQDSGVAVGGSDPQFSGNAVVLKTNDGGNSWQRVHRSTRADDYCWKVSFVNRNIGFASIQGGSHYLKTTNGGQSWEEKLFGSYFKQGIGFINENTGWIGGWSGPNWETTDAGNTWHHAGWGENVNRFRFINDTLAYAVGKRVYKYSRETVGINLATTEIPSTFQLHQNYPNPFNPVTNLEFGIPELEFVSLKIYDLLGREIATLVNEKLSAGSYEVEFNANNFSSGVYFYKLQAGDFVETKRMMVLK